jgi:hypothetical protein
MLREVAMSIPNESAIPPNAQPLSHATLTAAGLMGLTVFIHVLMGGPEVHDPMLASTLPIGLKAFASILWHAVTVVLVVFTFALYSLARKPNWQLEATLGAIQLGFAALFIGYGVIRLGTIWPMPQWIIFAGLPLLTRIGQHRTAH